MEAVSGRGCTGAWVSPESLILGTSLTAKDSEFPWSHLPGPGAEIIALNPSLTLPVALKTPVSGGLAQTCGFPSEAGGAEQGRR